LAANVLSLSARLFEFSLIASSAFFSFLEAKPNEDWGQFCVGG
jgi:hypothetical protein